MTRSAHALDARADRASARARLARAGIALDACACPFMRDGERAANSAASSRTPRAPSFELHAAAELFAQLFAMRLEIDRLKTADQPPSKSRIAAEEALRRRAFVAGLGRAEFLEQLLLLGAHPRRRFDQDARDQVAAAAAVEHAHARAAMAQLLARLDAGRDLDARPACRRAPAG